MKTENLRLEMTVLIKKEQVIHRYQNQADTFSQLVNQTGYMSGNLLEFIREFSLNLLPEMRKRQDMELAQKLQSSWSQMKTACQNLENSQEQLADFQSRLEVDYRALQERKATLLDLSGLSQPDFDQLYDQLYQEEMER